MTGRKRCHVIPLRLTEKELKHLNQLAAQSGLSREKLLRALIMGENISHPCLPEEAPQPKRKTPRKSREEGR